MARRLFALIVSVMLIITCLTGWGGKQSTSDPTVSEPATAVEAQNTLSYDELTDQFSIYAIYPTKPNSAGGVTVVLMFETYLDEEIKYLTLDVAPYNAVDDKVASDIGNKSDVKLQLTGPIEKGSNHCFECENVWYNSTIKYVVVSSITIEYMNGDIVICDTGIPVDKRDK